MFIYVDRHPTSNGKGLTNMIYKDFKGKKISLYGMGTMRLPVIDGDDSRIDEAATFDMVDYAIENGVNYFDTAWGYHGGNSETVMGKALARHPRDSYYLADKFPGYDLSNMDKVEEIFEEQLRKCGVDHFDFYLIHNVCELNIDAYLDPKHGIHDYLMEQKRNGRITHLGFSVHGSYDVMKRFLDAYGRDMEFCQVQLNYVDWGFQDAKAKVELLRNMGIPCWVMEPVRGGRLANLSEAEADVLKGMRPDEAPVAWAFRFLQSLPEVTVILSGASNMEQMRQNIAICEEDRPLDGKEMESLLALGRDMVDAKAAPCTACKYCLSHCPKGIDIPRMIELYNEHVFTGGGFIAPMALAAIPQDRQPSACIGCGKCAEVCPQQIDIPGIMKDFVQKLGA